MAFTHTRTAAFTDEGGYQGRVTYRILYESSGDTVCYGIAAEMRLQGTSPRIAEVRDITRDAGEALCILDLLADNALAPEHLRDWAEDYVTGITMV